MRFIRINISNLFPKIDEVLYIANITNFSIIGISKIKQDETFLPSELEVDGYNLVKLNWSRRVGGVARYIKSSTTYSYIDSFCSNTESIFFTLFLRKSKPILLRILCRTPNKSDFLKYINDGLMMQWWKKFSATEAMEEIAKTCSL